MNHKILWVGRGKINKEGVENDIQLSDKSISRSHLKVFIDGEGNIFITDLDTGNGSYVNGNRITGDTLLKRGDILKLGTGKPILWDRWVNLLSEQPKEPIEIESEYQSGNIDQTTTVSSVRKGKKSILSIVVVIVVLIFVSFLIYKNYGSSEKNKINKVLNATPLSNAELEKKTYAELVKLTETNPEVKLAGNRITTSDRKLVTIITDVNNRLIGVRELPANEKVDIQPRYDTTFKK